MSVIAFSWLCCTSSSTKLRDFFLARKFRVQNHGTLYIISLEKKAIRHVSGCTGGYFPYWDWLQSGYGRNDHNGASVSLLHVRYDGLAQQERGFYVIVEYFVPLVFSTLRGKKELPFAAQTLF